MLNKRLINWLGSSIRLIDQTHHHHSHPLLPRLRRSRLDQTLLLRTSLLFSASTTGFTGKSNEPRPGSIILPSSSDNSSSSNHHHHSISNFLPSIRLLASRLPPTLLTRSHRLTPSDLLPLAQSRLERLKIRWKWLTIRSFRAYRPDDYSAFASLFVIINLLLAGIFTTTFLGGLIFIFNKAGLEHLLANWLSDRLSTSMGVRIVFGSALVPRWRDGIIRFSNVWVSRPTEISADPREPSVEKLIQLMLEANQVNLPDQDQQLQMDQDHYYSSSPEQDLRPHIIHSHPISDTDQSKPRKTSQPDNFTHFHLSISSIDVTLSLGRWLDGKGLIKSAKLSGIRGVIDRSHLSIQESNEEPVDRKSSRKKPSAGDFHLESVSVDDLLLTVFQPNSFRPYTFSIFNAHFNKLRRQWLFLDLLSADQMTGQLDNCLFSLHKPQSILTSSNKSLDDFPNQSKRVQTRLSRFRIDGVPIDHIRANNPIDTVGPLSWIQSGKVDLIADIRLPLESEEIDLKTVVKEIVDNFEKEIVKSQPHAPSATISERRQLVKPALEAPGIGDLKYANQLHRRLDDEPGFAVAGELPEERVMIDLDLRFKDVKASMFDKSLTYVNTALVRSIVAFINANRTLIPIKCQVLIDLDDFNGSWTTFDVGLIESISEQVYKALAYHVGSDEAAKSNRISHVSRWGIAMTASSILQALKLHWDSAH
ncbi:mitochondrial inner membrane protein Mdm31 [Phakopsora pachyrhizi]|nr:mitochondrial inner membrane protein Mdm31 [Phakopsora pachyrhizi]